MTTATSEHDVRKTLNSGNDNKTADALKRIKAGNMMSLIQVTFTGLPDVAAQDITTAAAKTKISAIDGITLDTGENLPSIGVVVALRTTAGTLATHGTHVVGDAGTTALVPQADSSGVAALSADGKTITFQAGVTAFVLWYYPKEYVHLDTEFPMGAP
jgi:hypothetical protein